MKYNRIKNVLILLIVLCVITTFALADYANIDAKEKEQFVPLRILSDKTMEKIYNEHMQMYMGIIGYYYADLTGDGIEELIFQPLAGNNILEIETVCNGELKGLLIMGEATNCRYNKEKKWFYFAQSLFDNRERYNTIWKVKNNEIKQVVEYSYYDGEKGIECRKNGKSISVEEYNNVIKKIEKKVNKWNSLWPFDALGTTLETVENKIIYSKCNNTFTKVKIFESMIDGTEAKELSDWIPVKKFDAENWREYIIEK